MNTSTRPTPADQATPALAIAGEFNIFTATDTMALLMNAITAAPYGSDSDIGIDLSQVTDIDSAGLQLMVMARREARREGKHLHFVRCSDSVTDLVALCDMAEYLGVSVPSSPTF